MGFTPEFKGTGEWCYLLVFLFVDVYTDGSVQGKLERYLEVFECSEGSIMLLRCDGNPVRTQLYTCRRFQ